MKISRIAFVASVAAPVALLAVGACSNKKNDDRLAEDDRSGAVIDGAEGGVGDKKSSIIRPEVEAEQNVAPRQPLEASISFADNGTALSDAAKSELDEIAGSREASAGGDIVLRGHTDSAGDDKVNKRISQRRAEAVRDYLVEQGIAPERIRVIALGETRPIAPNATLDGDPDEAGMAKNRRVDILIMVPESADNGEEANPPQTGPEKSAAGAAPETQ